MHHLDSSLRLYVRNEKMNIMFAGAFLLIVAGPVMAAAPVPSLAGAPVRPIAKAQPAPDLNDETGEKQWDEDVQRTFQTVRKLKREMALLTHENNGLKALLAHDHAAAKAAYDSLLELDPDQTDARVYRAASRSVLGDLEGALADYSLALNQLSAALGSEVDPKLKKRMRETIARIHGDRASTYMRIGIKGKGDAASLNRALADCDAAISMGHPTPVMITWQKSQILFAANRYEEAAKAYQQALSLDPKLKDIGDHALFCRKFADTKITIGTCN